MEIIMINFTIPDDMSEAEFGEALTGRGDMSKVTISNADTDEDTKESAHAEEEEETVKESTADTEETETTESDEDDTTETSEEAEEEPKEEEDASAPVDSKEEPEVDTKQDKTRPNGAQRAIDRERARRAKVEAENKRLREELVKRLPEEDQVAYQKQTEQQVLRDKELQIQAYEAQQSFNAQLGSLTQDEIQVLQGASTDAFEAKPQTMLAIQTSSVGAKALAALVQSPEKMAMFEQLSDSASLEFMKIIAQDVALVQAAPVAKPVESIAPVTPKKQPPAPTPKPTKANNVGESKSFNLMDANDDELHRWLQS